VTQTVIPATADGTHWGVVLAVLVAAGVGALNAWQVYLTRKALAVARDATQEGVKARVDQQAPRVVVRRVNRDRFVWFPSTVGGNPNPADRGELMMFRVPTHNDQALFVRVDLWLRNEGPSSGWVSSSIKFLAPTAGSEARAYFVRPPTTPYERGRVAPVFIDTEADLEDCIRVELECPLSVWLASSPIEAELTIRVADSHEPGIEDEIPVLMRASPFMMDAHDAGRAVVRQGIMDAEPVPPLVECSVMRSHRRYSWEPSK